MSNNLLKFIFENFSETRYVPGQNLPHTSTDRPNSLTDPAANSYVSRKFFVEILPKMSDTAQYPNTILKHVTYLVYYTMSGIIHSFIHSFIHLVICLTTGPKHPQKRAPHIMRSRASSFN